MNAYTTRHQIVINMARHRFLAEHPDVQNRTEALDRGDYDLMPDMQVFIAEAAAECSAAVDSVTTPYDYSGFRPHARPSVASKRNRPRMERMSRAARRLFDYTDLAHTEPFLGTEFVAQAGYPWGVFDAIRVPLPLSRQGFTASAIELTDGSWYVAVDAEPKRLKGWWRERDILHAILRLLYIRDNIEALGTVAGEWVRSKSLRVDTQIASAPVVSPATSAYHTLPEFLDWVQAETVRMLGLAVPSQSVTINITVPNQGVTVVREATTQENIA